MFGTENKSGLSSRRSGLIKQNFT